MRSLLTLSAVLAVAEAQAYNGTSPNAADALTVDVGYGKYRGFEDGGARKWYGVRFAAPPTGNNRFRDPQDPEPFDGVQDATEFGAICPPQQASDYTLSGQSDRFHVDEDCLFLSVTAPASTTDLKPVHVFIQGGGFSSNSNANIHRNPFSQPLSQWRRPQKQHLDDRSDNRGHCWSCTVYHGIRAVDAVSKAPQSITLGYQKWSTVA